MRSVAILLALVVMAPSMIKLGHGFHGHWDEIQCHAQGTDHIHSPNLDCSFNDHTLGSKLLFSSQFIYVPVVLHKPAYHNGYIAPRLGSSLAPERSLRGPPVLS